MEVMLASLARGASPDLFDLPAAASRDRPRAICADERGEPQKIYTITFDDEDGKRMDAACDWRQCEAAMEA